VTTNEHAARLREMAIDWDNALNAHALLAGAEALEAVEVAKAALESIHKGTCLTAQESRSRDDDRYCLADVMNTARGALARLEGE
jgi:hypothetical protein